MIIDGKEFVTIDEASKIAEFKISKYNRKNLKTYITLKRRSYVSREEAEQLKLSRLSDEVIRKEYVTIQEANELLGFNISHKRRKFLKTYIVVDAKAYVSREEIKQIIPSNTPSAELMFEGKKYISLEKAKEILGLKRKLNEKQRSKLRTYTTITHERSMRTHAYVTLDEIEELIKLREETIGMYDCTKGFPQWGHSAIVQNIHALGLEVIKKTDNFWGKNLIYKKDLEQLSKCLKTKSDIDEASSKGNGLELYRIYTKDIHVKPEVTRTMASFDNYVVKRFSGEVRGKASKRYQFKSARSRKVYARFFANTYQMLVDTFAMDLEKYEEKTVNEMVARACEGKDKSVSKEFVWFLNELIKEMELKRELFNYDWEFSKVKRGETNQGGEGKQEEKVCSDEVYSQEQFIKLWRFLHCGVKNREYLLIFLDNRLASQKWLYMYLHFNTLWRQGDMINNLPSPNLSLLSSYGITDGESLFKWLRDDKNVFSDEMGMAITESVKGQVKGFELKISKTNQNLFMEVGRLMSPVLGMLLAICEGHRQIYEKKGYKNTKYDVMLTRTVTNGSNPTDAFIDIEVMNILGERFQNRKGNRAYNNYIHNYSEETKSAFAVHMISIMRGYVDEESETTTIYEKRKADGTIDDIVAKLFDMGSCAFVKLLSMSICDKSTMRLDRDEQIRLIKSLEITPYQAEMATKNVFEQSSMVMKLFSDIMIEPKTTRKILWQLAYGDGCCSKHHHAKCLFKAMLNAGIGIDEINDIAETMSFIERIKYARNTRNCLYPDADTCFGCPMLIAEMYFLYELNDIMMDTIKSLEACDKQNEFECYMYSNLIFNTYKPLLQEAQAVIGKERVNVFVDMIAIRDKIISLYETGKITLKLKEEKNDYSVETVGGYSNK